MKNSKLLLYAVAVGAGFLLCGATHAQDWKVVGEFGWVAVGKAHQVEKGHFYWVGEFSGTFFNDKGKGSLFHRAGVKVLYPIYAWDMGTRRPADKYLWDGIARILAEVGADGINGDTLSGVPWSYRTASDKIGR